MTARDAGANFSTIASPTASVVFTRAQFEVAPGDIMSRGHWANALLYLHSHDNALWVVKDFRSRSFLVRNCIGRILIRREAHALRRLAGLEGVVQDAFRLDAYALAYRFVRASTLQEAQLGAGAPHFFAALERLLRQVHEVGAILHLDVRNARNVLVSERGEPILLDFQSYLSTRWMPRRLREWLERFDLSGVYKHWARISPESFDETRAQVLADMNRWRRFWILRGYMGMRKS